MVDYFQYISPCNKLKEALTNSYTFNDIWSSNNQTTSYLSPSLPYHYLERQSPCSYSSNECSSELLEFLYGSNNDSLSCASTVRTPEVEQQQPSYIQSYYQSLDPFIFTPQPHQPDNRLETLQYHKNTVPTFYTEVSNYAPTNRSCMTASLMYNAYPVSRLEHQPVMTQQQTDDDKSNTYFGTPQTALIPPITQSVLNHHHDSKVKDDHHFYLEDTQSIEQDEKIKKVPDNNIFNFSVQSSKPELSSESFPCKFPNCKKVFPRPYNLKSHMRMHSLDRPYECQYKPCTWKFARLHDLKRHELQHTGLKPHTCKYCFRKFARSDALKRHWKVDTICSQAFKNDPSDCKLPTRGRKKGSGKKKKNNETI
ncbi:hypothetical protein G6F33_009185 [Rhizopus arrhizus]|nr:hypothetical protein G6F23_011212 [Rhizopus arrhizus]KAG0755682.1 hypothetical protein G6F24_011670 [Rhizopus arrhizus]KAG0909004.1 hypothetical protein G6F33_009185 [Rhizopus arrhizus]KAG0932621.1 hypothetical protein G6F32_011309 [Rhizopus arrhizus]